MDIQEKTMLFERITDYFNQLTPEETLCLLNEYDVPLEPLKEYQTSLSEVNNIKIGQKGGI